MSPNRNRHSGSTHGPKPAADCISLGAIAERARALDELDARLRRLLPPALAREIRLADCHDGRIVFLASNPAWASRLRLHQAALLAAARAALGGTVEHFAVKIAPLPAIPPRPAKPKPLSTAAARHLRAAADTLADPELRALYLDLASTATAADT